MMHSKDKSYPEESKQVLTNSHINSSLDTITESKLLHMMDSAVSILLWIEFQILLQ